MHKPP